MHPDSPSQWQPAESPAPAPAASPASPRTSRAGLAATVAGVALFGALLGFAADRWVVTTFGQTAPTASAPTVTTTGPRTGPVAAPNGGPTGQVAPAPTPTDPAQQAIQQVIQRGDEEQARAFASNDPTVMLDTSTSDFYQSQVTNDQDMRANGVTDIKLVSIEWGPISVNGTTATATAWETWTTSFSDGTTEQSRDRNVYTLVQQNGAWVISTDDHPDSTVGGTGGTPPAAQVPGGNSGQPGAQVPGQPSTRRTQPPQSVQPGQPGQPGQPTQPRSGRSRDVSQNWSGYAATGGTFTAVSGTWTVPQFSAESPAGADAAWVGIGGVNTRDLIQAGTQQTVSGNGSTQYEAWVETLPQASHPVPLAVSPGDSISVSISQVPQTQDHWQISFVNNTTGKTYSVNETYASSLSSAEWIEEAPSAARGRQLPLDNFGSITFSQGSAVKNGQTVTIADSGAAPITMVSRGNGQVARPSSLGTDGATFTVTQG